MPKSRHHAPPGQEPGTPPVLNVPGLGSSGAGHWQTHWEQRYPWFRRVELGLWDAPDRNLWVERLDAEIRRAGRPVILVAHSLGAIAVAWWAAINGHAYREPVAGALLVAPADPDDVGAHSAVAGFAPLPRQPLPFPSILVASRNDPHATFDRSTEMARNWGSHIVDAGESGHINADSGLGEWPLGLALIERLQDAAELRDRAERGLAGTASFLSVTPSPQAAIAGGTAW